MSEETKTYEVVNPIAHKGTRIERGSTLVLTEDEAKNYGDLVKSVDEENAETEATEETTDETDESKDETGETQTEETPNEETSEEGDDEKQE